MTRPFGLRDLGLLWGLRGRGITLDMQRAVMSGRGALGPGLSGLLAYGVLGTTLTYVCRWPEGSDRDAPDSCTHGLVQVEAFPERQEWQVTRLAPWVETADLEGGLAWVRVLADLCAWAGHWGALRIRAGVQAGGAEEEAFHQAGYAAYTREEVYCLARPRPVQGAGSVLRPITVRDSWPLAQLVDQVVPSAVQHAEGTNVSGLSVPILARLGVTREQGFVLPRGDGLGAYVGLSRGRGGAWARILLHPDARKQAADIVRHTITLASPGPSLYFAVRDYQAGLRSLLVAMGFTFVGVQIWLVKHTTRPVVRARYRHLVAVDKRVEPAPTPLHPVSDSEPVSCSAITREHWTYEYRRADRYAVGSD